MYRHFPSSDNRKRKGSWMQYAALERNVPPWQRSSKRPEQWDPVPRDLCTIRFSAHYLTLVAVLAASGNSTSNPCSAILELMVWLQLWWQQGLCGSVAVSGGYIPNCWSCSSLVFMSKLPLEQRDTSVWPSLYLWRRQLYFRAKIL